MLTQQFLSPQILYVEIFACICLVIEGLLQCLHASGKIKLSSALLLFCHIVSYIQVKPSS